MVYHYRSEAPLIYSLLTVVCRHAKISQVFIGVGQKKTVNLINICFIGNEGNEQNEKI